jgi:hypothetical protein
LSVSTSPKALVDLFAEIAPVPIDAHREGLETLMDYVQRMSWEEVSGLSEVSLTDWLAGRGADPVVSKIICALAAKISEIDVDVAERICNAYGILTKIRTLLLGEAFCTSPVPDPWEGLVMPLARGLEEKGCTILRSAKVDDVIIEDGRAVGVRLRSGEEVRGRAVALATGTPRVGKIMKELPPSVQAAVDHAATVKGFDCCTYTLLSRDVTNGLANIRMITDETGANRGYVFPMHAVSPGSVEPGAVLLAAQSQHMPEEYEKLGGHDGAVQHLVELQERLYPGFEEATIERSTQVHPYGWLNPSTHGPKLPGTCPEVPGLYFAGDGSVPTRSFGVEGAAQAGTLRANTIADDLAAVRIDEQQKEVSV